MYLGPPSLADACATLDPRAQPLLILARCNHTCAWFAHACRRSLVIVASLYQSWSKRTTRRWCCTWTRREYTRHQRYVSLPDLPDASPRQTDKTKNIGCVTCKRPSDVRENDRQPADRQLPTENAAMSALYTQVLAVFACCAPTCARNQRYDTATLLSCVCIPHTGHDSL